MKKDEYLIGYTPRYIALPKTYAVWDTQTQCWVGDTDNTEQSTVQETAEQFNNWNNKANTNDN